MTTAPHLIQLSDRVTQTDLRKLRAQETGNSVIFDLTTTQHMDSGSLAQLIDIQQKLQRKGYDLALINPQAPIRTLLYVTRVNQLIGIFPNLTAANRHFIQNTIAQGVSA